MANNKQDNPWRSVDANGKDWNAGEEFDPVPKQSAQQTAVAAQPVGQAAGPGFATAQPVTQSATQSVTPQSQTLTDFAALVQQSGQQTPVAHADTSAIRGYLEQAKDAAVDEAVGRIERGVTQGVNELRRVQEDAGEEYRTQQNQIDLNERLALDNRAAYDAARGVRGGIAGEQYNSIMNTAARNRATLNTERTKLGTNLKRQMAELRANGEWEKSAALLQATQQYMAQLAQLEQWAQEFNVGVDEFNAQMEQNRLNFLFEVKQAAIATEQWERQFAWNVDVDRRNYEHQIGREAIDDARYAEETAYQRGIDKRNYEHQIGREAIDDARYAEETAYQRGIDKRNYEHQIGREAIDDARYADETAYQRGIDKRNYEHQIGREAIDDARYADETAYQRGIDKRNYEHQIGREAIDDARYADNQAAQARQDASERAYAMMNVGMTPDAETLKAAGLSKEYAQLYISTVQAAQNVAGGQNGNLTALAKAFVESGSENPKTWLSENYKSFGFSSKPDFDEFEDAADVIRDAPKLSSLAFDFSPDEGIITFNGQKFEKLADFVEHVNDLMRAGAFTESAWNTLMNRIRRYPELAAALDVTETEG